MRKLIRSLKEYDSNKYSLFDRLYFSKTIDPLFQSYYNICNFFFKVKRSIAYAKVSWGVYDFDYTSSLVMFEYALSRTEKSIINGHAADAKKTAKKVRIIRNLLRRISKDETESYDYIIDDLYAKYGKNDWDFEPTTPERRFFRIKNRNPSYDTEAYKKDFKRAIAKQELLQKRDLELFAKLFVRDIKSFWD